MKLRLSSTAVENVQVDTQTLCTKHVLKKRGAKQEEGVWNTEQKETSGETDIQRNTCRKEEKEERRNQTNDREEKRKSYFVQSVEPSANVTRPTDLIGRLNERRHTR